MSYLCITRFSEFSFFSKLFIFCRFYNKVAHSLLIHILVTSHHTCGNYGERKLNKCMFCRKSVIVKNTYQCEKGENVEEDFADIENINFDCMLTIQDIENIYTVEEGLYRKKMMNTFYDNWKLVSYGPKIMNFYINFCQNPGALPQKYLKDNNKVSRYTPSEHNS